MNRTILCLLIVVCFSGVASAQTSLWDGGGPDNSWHTPENWDPDGIPDPCTQCRVGSSGTAEIAADVNVNRIDCAFYGEGDGHVIINAGDVLSNASGFGLGQGSADYTGQLTINGGTLTLSGWGMMVGYQNGTGILNMNAGLLDCGGTPLRVGYGTWGADEVTEGYVYLHGGTIIASLVTLYDLGSGAGSQWAEMEICGDGKLILNNDVVAEINEEIEVYGTIYACEGKKVVATYDSDTNKTTVQLYNPNAVNLVGAYVDAVPADLPNGNTVRASDGATGSWYDGPTDVWSTPHAPNWFAYSGDSGLNSIGEVGIDSEHYSLNYYGEGGDPLPTLRTTITGLQDNGLYDVYVVYKSALVPDPNVPPTVPATEGVKAGLTGQPTVVYNNVDGVYVGPENSPADKSYFQALLGNVRAYGGEISVDVDVIGTDTGYETLYDGLTHQLVGELPSCEEILGEFRIAADVSGPAGEPDCYINLYDFAVLFMDWMRCIEPSDNNCEHPWE